MTTYCYINRQGSNLQFGKVYREPEEMHIICNMGTHELPDMYALRPVALELWAYISGRVVLGVGEILYNYL